MAWIRAGKVGAGTALTAAVLGAPAVPAAAAGGSELRGAPVVVAGAELERLEGTPAGRLVAYRFRESRRGRPRWRQVPMQLDERKLVDFGSWPPSNSTPGQPGTVYGTEPIGVTALQYADPGTFVGADPEAGLDADDEVALMAFDAGERAGRGSGRPQGGRRRVELKLRDPLAGGKGFLYLFRARRAADPAAGRDYVDYDFRLASGDYRATYRRRNGPNPETSTIATRDYRIGFSDRWYFDDLAIEAGEASGAEILDGFKFQFDPLACGRSEATFNEAEGAFVANLDGPVRAIRSYVGANSGPLTQRTNIFYRDRHEIVTDLRVHSVSGLMTYHDFNAAGLGLSYLDSHNPDPLAVDGVPEPIAEHAPDWRLWTGPQGSLVSADRAAGSHADELLASARGWYLDDATPAGVQTQCWGDERAYGQAGIRSQAWTPNTDPLSQPVETLRVTTTDLVAPPGLDGAEAEQLAAGIDAPLQVTPR